MNHHTRLDERHSRTTIGLAAIIAMLSATGFSQGVLGADNYTECIVEKAMQQMNADEAYAECQDLYPEMVPESSTQVLPMMLNSSDEHNLAVADANGDGNPDLFVSQKGFAGANSSGEIGVGDVVVTILFGDGNGNFEERVDPVPLPTLDFFAVEILDPELDLSILGPDLITLQQ